MNKDMSTLPLVSIICITYNHADYIRECLNGFLMQRINFSIEILVHDDASSDNTPNIIREYEENHPSLFRVIYQTTNQYSQGISPWYDILFPIAKGKYIAICEGDDYWTDPYKLQKQVDFLEANPDYGMVHTDFNIVNYSSVPEHRRHRKYRQQTKLEDLLLFRTDVGTLSVVFKKNTYDLLPKLFKEHKFLMGDLPMWLEFTKYSKVAYINEVTASYRRLDSSASHSVDLTKQIQFYDNLVECRLLYASIFCCNHLISKIEAYRYILREKMYYHHRSRVQTIKNFGLLCLHYPQCITLRAIYYALASLFRL